MRRREEDRDLHEAIEKLNIQGVINAIKSGANVNAVIDYSYAFEYKWGAMINQSILTHALNSNYSFNFQKLLQNEIIKLLIDNGAKIDDSYTCYSLISPPILTERSKFTNIICRLTAIERAADQDNLEIVKYMIDKGANPTCYYSITYNEYNTSNKTYKTYTIPDGGEKLEQYQEIEEKIRECKSNKDITKIALEYPQYMVHLAEKRVSLEKKNKNILEYLDQATSLYNSQIRGKDINHILDSIENNNIMDFQKKLPLVLDKTTYQKKRF
ncbi:MAG: hypothetical protein KTV77_04330 [Wolbachia endosymbiont of Fragariocoptes setiger]|nr:hypothetical protein [Wolbachia endosymbiont of Fragariocoptes setiger]